ncbi:glycosyltransferase family 2 protein [Celeribacter sp.]|uniref:glycosyltransferase family 2 protein n=1 Tax=Celeribacter sp. TaxID=1890673 RepID=UPI003A959673
MHLRARRRRLLVRAFRKRRELRPVKEATAQVTPDAPIYAFSTVRNEARRLPYFLDHHRALGVGRFHVVDNASDDGTAEFLADQPDVSLWTSAHSYRRSRFGMDWMNWLLLKHGHGKWCLTLDADEALIIPHMETRGLRELTAWLDARDVPFFAATMLDLYPEGRLSETSYSPGQPFTDALPWYDVGNYTRTRVAKFRLTSIRGGVRKRVFFEDRPELSPHLHKTPLIKWHWRYAYASSTHIALPTKLNEGFEPRLNLPTGVLAHSKFLDEVVQKSNEEKLRGEHFTRPKDYDDYYEGIVADPCFKTDASQRYRGWEGLVVDGLMTAGAWK